jgi:4-amino-4-deoxy-L-arabinose transferase-like glycosyltransferase
MSTATKKINKPLAKKENILSKLSQYLQTNPIIVWGFFIGAFIIISFLAFYQLGNAPLANWDEAWYADVTRNMMRTHNYFVAQWNEAVWLDKPPVYMWLSAIVSSIIGLSELSFRIPSAISGVLVVMLVLWFAFRNYGLVPAFLAFITLAFNNIFVWRMRSGNIDVLPTLFIVLLFLVQVSKLKHRYLFIGILFSLLYMTKASLVGFPLLVFILYEIIFERSRFRENGKAYLTMTLVALFLPVCWLLIGTAQIGPRFFQYFLFQSDQGVASVSLHKFSTDYLQYLYYSLQRRFTAVLVVGVIFAIRYIKDPKVFLMLAYGSLLLLQLSFTERSNNWYLVPSMPFWSLLIAFGTYHIIKLVRGNLFVVLFIVLASAFLGYRTFVTSVFPTVLTTANTAQMQSSKLLHDLTKEGDVVVRLDALYPTTVYYSQRRVLSAAPEAQHTTGYWITRKDLIQRVKEKKLRWIIGTSQDVASVQSQLPSVNFKLRKVNDSESILEVL